MEHIPSDLWPVIGSFFDPLDCVSPVATARVCKRCVSVTKVRRDPSLDAWSFVGRHGSLKLLQWCIKRKVVPGPLQYVRVGLSDVPVLHWLLGSIESDRADCVVYLHDCLRLEPDTETIICIAITNDALKTVHTLASGRPALSEYLLCAVDAGARTNRRELIEWFLARGAPWSTSEELKDCEVAHALIQGNTDLADWLLSKGASGPQTTRPTINGKRPRNIVFHGNAQFIVAAMLMQGGLAIDAIVRVTQWLLRKEWMAWNTGFLAACYWEIETFDVDMRNPFWTTKKWSLETPDEKIEAYRRLSELDRTIGEARILDRSSAQRQ